MVRRVVSPQPSDHHWSRLPGYRHKMIKMETSKGLSLRSSHLYTSAAGSVREDGIEWCNFPYGNVGDRLWVRESWKTYATLDHLPPSKIKPWGPGMEYLAGGSTAMGQPLHGMGKSRPSISMPRWASRIDLEITGVRIERLNQISNEDILREGIRSESCNICVHTGGSGCDHCLSLVKPFRELWDSINGKTPGKSWDDNPFVWVVEFKRGEK